VSGVEVLNRLGKLLGRLAPQRTLIVATGTKDIPGGGSLTLVDVAGRGEVDGLSLVYWGAGMVTAQLDFYIDGAKTTYFLTTLAAPLLLYAPAAGAPAKPVALIQYDDVNNVYKVAFNSPIRFTASFRLVLVNNSAATVKAAATAFVHLYA
jgi:hypothetical protein